MTLILIFEIPRHLFLINGVLNVIKLLSHDIQDARAVIMCWRLVPMGRSCRGYCLDYVCQGIPNGIKYELCKRCTYCGVFLKTTQVRCPCCGVTLRTKPRSKKLDKSYYLN